MPFEDSKERAAVGYRARAARRPGEVTDTRGGVQQSSEAEFPLRENAQFEDQTGATLIGIGTIGGMTTL